MAIFGTLQTVRAQTQTNARDATRYAAAFAHIAECATPGTPAHKLLHALAPGASDRVDLANGAFALPQAYMTKTPRETGFFESHLAHVDIQAIITGEEIIEVADTAALAPTENHTPAKDLIKYALPAPAKTSRLRLRAGDLAILAPADAHMPCLATGNKPALVRKVVIKIPVS